MKKIFYLLMLPFVLFSCFEEEAVPGFFNGTTWVNSNSGSAYEGDRYLYSYIETHTLVFAETTFTYTVNRKRTDGAFEAEEETTTGAYAIKYPEVTLSSEKYQKLGTLSVSPTGINVLLLDSGKKDQPLLFIRR
ncbi:MAG: hypothetical protein LBQ65_02860 [Tannerellaceae bacterium]|jgi:hypothetical protein|nr:hypothetical protein [Tannerellaceae bacterium]